MRWDGGGGAILFLKQKLKVKFLLLFLTVISFCFRKYVQEVSKLFTTLFYMYYLGKLWMVQTNLNNIYICEQYCFQETIVYVYLPCPIYVSCEQY